MKKLRAWWIVISISSFYYIYSTHTHINTHTHTQHYSKTKNYLLLKAEIAQKCLASYPEKARVLFNEVISELQNYYAQDSTNNQLSDFLSEVEFHLGCLDQEAHNIDACIRHFDKALSYTRGFFPAAFARLSRVYLDILEKAEAVVPQGLLIRYIDYCDKYFAHTTLLPYEVVYIAELVKTRIQCLLAELWSELPATTDENRLLMQKALEYLPQLKLYVEKYRTSLHSFAIEQYITSSYYYSVVFWFSLGNYYADQAMHQTSSAALDDCDKALDYFTLIEQTYSTVLQACVSFMNIYHARPEFLYKLEEINKRYTYVQDVLKKTIVVKNTLLLKKAAVLQATGKKKQLEQAIALLEHALSSDTLHSTVIQQEFKQQLAQVKLQRIRCNVQNKNRLSMPDVEYALVYGTPAVQANALLMKVLPALARVTTCADFDAIAALIEQARTKTTNLPSDFMFVTAEYHKRRMVFLFKNQQLLIDTVLQEKFHESIIFCCNSCDSDIRHEGLHYKILWLIKQQIPGALCQALELLQELKLEGYSAKKIKHIVILVHTSIEQLYKQGQHADTKEILEILWQEYRSLDSGLLLVKILAQHKESLEHILRLTSLIKELLPLAGKHTQVLHDTLETCYYSKACYESTSFDKAVLERAFNYFKNKHLLADPAAQKACTMLAQQAETTEEFFAFVDQLQNITPYIKDTLVNLLHDFCMQVTAHKQCCRQEVTQKENVIKKYTRFLTEHEQQKILTTLYTTYMPKIIEHYITLLKQKSHSKKESKKCTQLLAYIQQLCSFLRKQNIPQKLLIRYQTKLQQTTAPAPNRLTNKRMKTGQSSTLEHTTNYVDHTAACLENLVIGDTLSNRHTSKSIVQDLDQTQEQDCITDYYFLQGVYYIRQEHAMRCKATAEQCATQSLNDTHKSTYAQLLYNQAQEYLFSEQQAIAYGLELLKNSAALDNLPAALELAHLYRRTHTLWPSLHSTLIDPASYGLPHYTYLVPLTNQPIVQSTAYKNWRLACATQANCAGQVIQRALVWSVYNPAIDSEVYQSIEQNEELCDAYLCGVAYAYLEHCARICQMSVDQRTRDYAPVIAQLLEEALLCPEQKTTLVPKRKKRKKIYMRDTIAQEITAWFDRTSS